MIKPTRFIHLGDMHVGHEIKNRHKVPMHDEKAILATMAFVKDFKPDVVIINGDALDCGAVSHWNRGKPGKTEGLKIKEDADILRELVLKPLEKVPDRRFIVGNHERAINDIIDELPGLEGALDVDSLLKLSENGWEVILQGGYTTLGKLTFIHGDQFRGGGEYVAKKAVMDYQRSIRLGHFHTLQTYTSTSAIDIELGRTGIAIPCLCRKDPNYTHASPNRWVQGFNYGYVLPSGQFSDYVVVIVRGQFVAEGRLYTAEGSEKLAVAA